MIFSFFFFFNDTATTEIYTLSLHDALPIYICEIYRVQGFTTQVLAASIRNPLHVVDAAKAGAHVVTMPFAVLEQLMKHPLTDLGLKKFLDDWAKLGEKI